VTVAGTGPAAVTERGTVLEAATVPQEGARTETADTQKTAGEAEAPIPLWEVFVRARNGLAHRHVGSLHAADATMALHAARDVYTRRGEGLSVWVVPSSAITASDPAEKGMMFEPTGTKIYRHPTFYDVPDEVGHM
jgi:ring-1,2-phenylacetyl-CoA epoxidase subunit PaaB